MFEHSLMKRVSRRIVDPKIFQFRGEDPIAVENLRLVGASFAQLQDSRHLADYDVTLNWTKADALDEVRTAALAFEAWARHPPHQNRPRLPRLPLHQTSRLTFVEG